MRKAHIYVIFEIVKNRNAIILYLFTKHCFEYKKMRSMRDAQLILGYSDVFSGEKPSLFICNGQINFCLTCVIIRQPLLDVRKSNPMTISLKIF